MKPRAHDYHSMLVGLLRHLGPDAVAIGLHAFPCWDSMRIIVGTDAAVMTLAESFGLDAPTTERAGTIAWTQAAAEEGRLRLVVKGPHAVDSDPSGAVGRGAGLALMAASLGLRWPSAGSTIRRRCARSGPSTPRRRSSASRTWRWRSGSPSAGSRARPGVRPCA
jgi:hypothetical protein